MQKRRGVNYAVMARELLPLRLPHPPCAGKPVILLCCSASLTKDSRSASRKVSGTRTRSSVRLRHKELSSEAEFLLPFHRHQGRFPFPSRNYLKSPSMVNGKDMRIFGYNCPKRIIRDIRSWLTDSASTTSELTLSTTAKNLHTHSALVAYDQILLQGTLIFIWSETVFLYHCVNFYHLSMRVPFDLSEDFCSPEKCVTIVFEKIHFSTLEL